MKIENKILNELDSSEFNNVELLHILNSQIKNLNFDFFESKFEIIIENCIIDNLSIHSCWFEEGLTFKSNHVMNYVNYQMGGHNKKNINITGNIFHDFVNFFDCHFENQLLIEKNIFLLGSNLLGNKNEGFANTFESEIIIKENIGNLDLDGLGNE
ncbi:hypothetical protein [Flavobacterium sp. N502540]|uniref:hypothetical protein n=1 Tax=Flavobacterium sp. N502540 TaxID=2986838 RepID=UPI0022252FAB|nr:hypothetical protein [Flavobacterium sp. N502540]